MLCKTYGAEWGYYSAKTILFNRVLSLFRLPDLLSQVCGCVCGCVLDVRWQARPSLRLAAGLASVPGQKIELPAPDAFGGQQLRALPGRPSGQ